MELYLNSVFKYFELFIEQIATQRIYGIPESVGVNKSQGPNRQASAFNTLMSFDLWVSSIFPLGDYER